MALRALSLVRMSATEVYGPGDVIQTELPDDEVERLLGLGVAEKIGDEAVADEDTADEDAAGPNTNVPLMESAATKSGRGKKN